MKPLAKAYIVMGVAGCGKTSVGQAIAAALGLPFIEGDTLHPETNIAKMSAGVPLTDEDRFPWLDRIGSAMATTLAGGTSLVVSCSALRRIYRDRLRQFGGTGTIFVFLNGSETLLTQRMAARKGHFMPVSLLKSQFATLEDPTEETGVLNIPIDGSTEEVVRTALSEIAKISL